MSERHELAGKSQRTSPITFYHQVIAELRKVVWPTRPQVVNYKQGTYQGKPDSPPYNAQYNGNRQEWENAIRARNQTQNEYRRTN